MRKNSTWPIRLALVLTLLVWVVGSAAGAPDKVEKPRNYPTRNIEVVVGFGAGGGTDVWMRAICNAARKIVGVPMVIVNMPGANGAVAQQYVANQPADGYTITHGSAGLLMNHLLGRDTTSFRDFIPIMRGVCEPLVLHLKANSTFKDIKDVIAYAKANPGRLTVAGTGALGIDETGVRVALGGADIKYTYVPFESASEMHAALIGGHVDMMVEEISVANAMIQARQIRPVLVFSDERLRDYPNVPCCEDLSLPVPPAGWRGIMVKKGTPPEIAEWLEYVFTEAMKDPTYQNYVKSSLLDASPGYMSGKDFGALWQREHELYKAVFREAGLLKVDQ